MIYVEGTLHNQIVVDYPNRETSATGAGTPNPLIAQRQPMAYEQARTKMKSRIVNVATMIVPFYNPNYMPFQRLFIFFIFFSLLIKALVEQ